MRYLLDTNIVSEARKKWPDPGVASWLGELRTDQAMISVLTMGEIRTGIARLAARGDANAAHSLETWVEGLEARYGDRILPITLDITTRWAAMSAARPLPAVDSLIAATAVEHGLVVATRNTKDFKDTGAQVFDPFSGRSST